MNLPALLLAFVIASIFAAVYHLWRGGGLTYILFYLLLAWAGFFSGHFLAFFMGWTFLPIGTLKVGFASLGAIIFLFVGDWLGRLNPRD